MHTISKRGCTTACQLYHMNFINIDEWRRALAASAPASVVAPPLVLQNFHCLRVAAVRCKNANMIPFDSPQVLDLRNIKKIHYKIHRCRSVRPNLGVYILPWKNTLGHLPSPQQAQVTHWLRERTHGSLSSLNLCLRSVWWSATDSAPGPWLKNTWIVMRRQHHLSTVELNQGAIGTACRNCMFCIVAMRTQTRNLGDPDERPLSTQAAKKLRVNGRFAPHHLTPATP